MPSPAMVIACIALICALGGTAYAAALAANSVKSKTIKNGQVKPPDLAAASKASWIYVDASGDRVNGSPGVTAERTNIGLYYVHFPFSVRNRAISGQVAGDPDNNISVERCGGAEEDSPSCTPEGNDSPNTVQVIMADTENGDDNGFSNQDAKFWLTAIP
jgi:hypothetical protein